MSFSLSESENKSFITALGTECSETAGLLEFRTPCKQADDNDMFKFSILQSDSPTERVSLPMDVITSNISHDMMVSPLAERSEADSVRTLNQHTIDLNLREDKPANFAFVRINPIANTQEVRDLVHDMLLDYINPFDDGGGRIIAEYDISSDLIREGRLVEKQYKLLARHATEVSGSAAEISEREFNIVFAEELQVVKDEKRIYNAREALSGLACNPARLEQAWREAEKDSSKGKIHRFGPDCYCGNLLLNGKNVYVMNGHFMALREQFVKAGSSTRAYVIQWTVETLSWKDFLTKAIGAVDPSKALPDSLRRTIFERYRILGMDAQPSLRNNCICASASPLEGLAERIHWCYKTVHRDEYGRILLGKGIPEAKILDWCDNVIVTPPPEEGSYKLGDECRIFDMVQGLNSKECAEKLTRVYDYELFGPLGGFKRKGICSGRECCIVS
jgi:hypothetical protein